MEVREKTRGGVAERTYARSCGFMLGVKVAVRNAVIFAEVLPGIPVVVSAGT